MQIPYICAQYCRLLVIYSYIRRTDTRNVVKNSFRFVYFNNMFYLIYYSKCDLNLFYKFSFLIINAMMISIHRCMLSFIFYTTYLLYAKRKILNNFYEVSTSHENNSFLLRILRSSKLKYQINKYVECFYILKLQSVILSKISLILQFNIYSSPSDF